VGTEKDSIVLELPQWFKDEMAAQEKAEQQRQWLDLYERHRMINSGQEEEILAKIPGKIQKITAMEDAPKGIVALAKKVTRAVKKVWKKDYGRYAVVSIGVGALSYLISPVDCIPDFIPGAGLLDDMFILTWAWGQIESMLK